MPVYRPIHGVIDLVLHDLDAGVLVAVEFHSQLRRLEQQIRWAHEKADALATSWQATLGGARGVTSPGVSRLGASVVTSPRVSRLLVLRSTAATRELARVFEETLRLEYPARTVDAHAACFREGEWPGSALLWASVDGSAVKILEAPPRGVALGR